MRIVRLWEQRNLCRRNSTLTIKQATIADKQFLDIKASPSRFPTSYLPPFFFAVLKITMPAATEAVTDQPNGYIHNLTPEQVEKLKQLWLRLFEIYDQKAEDSPTSTPTERSRQGSTDSKSSFGYFFGKKKKVERESVFLTSTFNDASGTTPVPLEEAIKSVSGKHLKDACWSAIGIDNPDTLLLRFLRARKWDVDAAFTMLSAALRWRVEERVDEIIRLGEAGLREELERLEPGASKKWLDQFNSGKSFVGGPDKGGRPVS